jgi:cytochrome P450
MHTRLFTPAHIARLQPRATRLAHELIDEFAGTGNVEWVSQFTQPYSFLVVSELFAIPEDDKDELMALAMDADQQAAVGQPGRSTIEILMGRVGEILGRHIPNGGRTHATTS